MTLQYRHATRASARHGTAAVAVCMAFLAGCALKAAVPPSDGHLDTQRAATLSAEEKILPPVTVTDFVPPPKPQVRLPTYTVVVHDVPVKELLFALARDTKQSIDVDP